MRTPRISLLFLFLFASQSFATEHWKWFTDEPREVKALFADPRETQMRSGYLRSGDHRNYLDLGFGGHLGIARKELPNGSFAVAVRGLATSRFEYASKSFDLQNSDFIGGISVSYRQDKDAYELLLAHQSSHLGDDLVARNPGLFKNYSFESLRFLYSRDLSPTIRLYAGADTKPRTEPSSLRWKYSVIAGGDWHFMDDFFTALDVRLKQENELAPNATLVVGYELGDAQAVRRRQRIFLEIFNGYSNLGQLSFSREFYLFLGFGYTL